MKSTYTATTLEKTTAIFVAAGVFTVVVVLVIRNAPISDPNLVVLLRITLSIAAGILGATIPGFLRVGITGGGLAIRAGGALALIVLTYFFSPAVLAARRVDPPPPVDRSARLRDELIHRLELADESLAEALSLVHKVKTGQPLAPQENLEASAARAGEYCSALSGPVGRAVERRTMASGHLSKHDDLAKYGLIALIQEYWASVNEDSKDSSKLREKVQLLTDMSERLLVMARNPPPSLPGGRAAEAVNNARALQRKDNFDLILREAQESLAAIKRDPLVEAAIGQ